MFKSIIIVLIIGILIVGMFLGIKEALAPTFNEEEFEIKFYTVKAGEGLDDLYYKFSSPEVDIYEYREAIKELNKMNDSMLYEGDRIKVYEFVK